jgi:hypothetical protein
MRTSVTLRFIVVCVATHFVSGCEQIMKTLGACEENCDAQQQNNRSKSRKTSNLNGCRVSTMHPCHPITVDWDFLTSRFLAPV